jgi:hypothetical protein
MMIAASPESGARMNRGLWQGAVVEVSRRNRFQANDAHSVTNGNSTIGIFS